MAKYLTRAMLVLADEHPHSKGAIDTALRYSPHTVALVAKKGTPIPGVEDVQHAGRGGHTIDTLFKRAAAAEIPWVAIPRDHAAPAELVGQVLEATGRHSSKHVPGFAVLLANPEGREIRRILAVIDRSEGNLSGMLVLAAVAAAITTRAQLDVLLIGAPGETLDGEKSRESLTVARAKEMFERAQRLAADAPERANWIVAEHVPDRTALVVDQARSGGYDLVMDDLGSVKLGGRMGRGGRLKRVFAAGGPGQTPLALLTQTDIPLMLVLDAVQLGLVPPVVVKGGAGAVLALGIAASASPAMASSGSLGGDSTTTISAQVDQTQTELQRILNPAPPAVETAAVEEAAPEEAAAEEAAAEEAAPEEAATVEAAAAPAEAEQASEEEKKEEEKKDEEPTLEDYQDAQADAEKSEDQMREAEEDLEKAEKEVEETTEALDETVDDVAELDAELAQAEADYQAAQQHAEDVAAEASGVSGVISGTSDEDVAAAEAEAANAGAALAEVEQEAARTVEEYDVGVEQAVDAQEDVVEAAEDADNASADYEDAAGTAEDMEEQLDDVRISPIAEGSYSQSAHYGDSGGAWSTGVHTGEDYAAPTGTTVMAAASGTVVYAGYDGAYGNRVVIQHDDGYYTTYNHLSQINVSVGQEVTVGDKIGEVGNTGNSFGSHLHFEVTQGGDGWSGGSFIDPDDWLADSA
jgi:murein DD-endopeptidase MepM/ murein hydrolase activator NlpD